MLEVVPLDRWEPWFPDSVGKFPVPNIRRLEIKKELTNSVNINIIILWKRGHFVCEFSGQVLLLCEVDCDTDEKSTLMYLHLGIHNEKHFELLFRNPIISIQEQHLELKYLLRLPTFDDMYVCIFSVNQFTWNRNIYRRDNKEIYT